MGDSPSDLKVFQIGNTVTISGEFQATIMDHQPMMNIQPFGQCQSILNPMVAAATAASFGVLRPMPCIPNTPSPWMNGKMNVFIKGHPALLDCSTLMCVWGGMIDITHHGQKGPNLVETGARPIIRKPLSPEIISDRWVRISEDGTVTRLNRARPNSTVKISLTVMSSNEGDAVNITIFEQIGEDKKELKKVNATVSDRKIISEAIKINEDWKGKELKIEVTQADNPNLNLRENYVCSKYQKLEVCGGGVFPVCKEAFEMILNTLTQEDQKFVQLDSEGFIDRDLINSHRSESGNFNALKELANSDILIEVSLASSFEYMDNEGNIQTQSMSHQGPDPYFVDATGGSTLSGTTTGESGWMGQTLLPGKGASGVNSLDGVIRVVVNERLSLAARAEMYSHEANGHALMFIRTGDRWKSEHQTRYSTSMNEPLNQMIRRSKMETVTNMRNR